jgi:hypothetical protein
MRAKHILILHTTLLAIFIIGSTALSLFVMFYSEVMSGKYLFFTFLALLVFIVGSWPLFGGCPFTIWENHYRELENPGSGYRGSCMIKYMKEWFGFRLPGRFDIYIPVAFVVLPIIVGLFNW